MNKKQIITCFMLLTLLLSLSGCSSNKIKVFYSPTAIATAAVKATERTENLELNMDMKMNTSSFGDTFCTNITNNIVSFKNPQQLKTATTSTISIFGSDTTIKSSTYIERIEDTCITYTQEENGVWSKEAEDISVYEEMKAPITPVASAYVEGIKNTRKVGQEKLENGFKTVVIEGTMSDEAINNIAAMLDDTNEEPEQNMSSFDIDEDIQLKVWIDIKTGYIMQIKIDMTDYMQAYILSLFTDFDFNIDECVILMEYMNYNNAEAFEIPDEAKQAN